jgi:hypothetical protein
LSRVQFGRLSSNPFCSGVFYEKHTAIPLQTEIEVLNRLIGPGTWMMQFWPQMAGWIGFVHKGILQTAKDYPFLQYGTDWLALGHVVIAFAFIGPLRDPVRNVWVVEMGMIACVLVLPVALGLGAVRQIPFFWRLIDCSFGVFGTSYLCGLCGWISGGWKMC